MSRYDCKICRESFGSYDALRRHVSRIHKIQSQQFYVDFYLDGKWPVCECGCGRRVKWSHQFKLFRDYCAGHQSRIHNNWGHNPNAIAKSSDTRRKQFASGERTVWNDGLTVEDERVKKNIDALCIAIRTVKERKARSNRMKRFRLNGVVPTLYGPNSSQWKGGISEINNIARSSKRLYDEWKYPILVRDGFKCKECGKAGPNLHIHHDKEQMCEIVKQHVSDKNCITDFDEKKVMADAIVDYHIKNKVSGITLCGKCHENYHPSLNFD